MHRGGGDYVGQHHPPRASSSVLKLGSQPQGLREIRGGGGLLCVLGAALLSAPQCPCLRNGLKLDFVN